MLSTTRRQSASTLSISWHIFVLPCGFSTLHPPHLTPSYPSLPRSTAPELSALQALALAGIMWNHMSNNMDTHVSSWGMDGVSRRRLSQASSHAVQVLEDGGGVTRAGTAGLLVAHHRTSEQENRAPALPPKWRLFRNCDERFARGSITTYSLCETVFVLFVFTHVTVHHLCAPFTAHEHKRRVCFLWRA